MTKMNDIQFAEYVAEQSFRNFSTSDARNASNDLLRRVVSGDFTETAKANARREMKARGIDA